jgi:nitrate/TMAO reductase-like tetraheme cytochrome c subunit
MPKWLKGVILVLVGILIAFPLFSLSYYTMVRTSTPVFCSICHEIKPAYNAWRTSTHVNNSAGFVADCMDCHLPAPHDTFDFFYAKTMHGAKDILVHFLKGPGAYDRASQRLAAYSSLKNEQCLKCHRNILYMPQKRGAMLAHRTVLYPIRGHEKKCTDCHRNLVHVDRAVYQYRQ